MSNENKFRPLKWGLLFRLLVYKSVIEFIYINSISKLYSYSGLSLDINIYNWFFSNLMLVSVFIFAPKNEKRPSTYLNITLIIFMYVPLTAYYWLNNKSSYYILAVTFCLIIVSLILRIKIPRKFIRIPYENITIGFIFVMYIALVIYIVRYRGGIDIRAFNFDLVYELREENNITGLMGYLVDWCAKSIFPFFIAYCWFFNKKKYIIVGVVIQLAMYLAFGNKAFLFSIGLVFFMLFISKFRNKANALVSSFSILCVLTYFFDYFNITEAFRRAITYRMLYIPAQIQFQYYEFFSVNPRLNFAEGQIGKIFGTVSPYLEPAPRLISRYFLQGESNSNTGIFSDAYSNGGFWYMIAFAVLLGLIFNILDIVSNKLPIFFPVISVSYIMFAMNDMSLLTTLLTGGLWLSLCLLFIANSKYPYRQSG